MARQFSLVYNIPPVTLLAPAADAAGRTSPYRVLTNAHKAWIVCRINQGNAATVLLSVLQGQTDAGTNSKAISANCPVWANQDVTSTGADGNPVSTAATTFTTSAATKDKRIIFEIDPSQHLDLVNGFNSIAVSTGASNAANITFAELFIYERFIQQVPPSNY